MRDFMRERQGESISGLASVGGRTFRYTIERAGSDGWCALVVDVPGGRDVIGSVRCHEDAHGLSWQAIARKDKHSMHWLTVIHARAAVEHIIGWSIDQGRVICAAE